MGKAGTRLCIERKTVSRENTSSIAKALQLQSALLDTQRISNGGFSDKFPEGNNKALESLGLRRL
jgi:hypothetical protein